MSKKKKERKNKTMRGGSAVRQRINIQKKQQEARSQQSFTQRPAAGQTTNEISQRTGPQGGYLRQKQHTRGQDIILASSKSRKGQKRVNSEQDAQENLESMKEEVSKTKSLLEKSQEDLQLLTQSTQEQIVKIREEIDEEKKTLRINSQEQQTLAEAALGEELARLREELQGKVNKAVAQEEAKTAAAVAQKDAEVAAAVETEKAKTAAAEAKAVAAAEAQAAAVAAAVAQAKATAKRNRLDQSTQEASIRELSKKLAIEEAEAKVKVELDKANARAEAAAQAEAALRAEKDRAVAALARAVADAQAAALAAQQQIDAAKAQAALALVAQQDPIYEGDYNDPEKMLEFMTTVFPELKDHIYKISIKIKDQQLVDAVQNFKELIK